MRLTAILFSLSCLFAATSHSAPEPGENGEIRDIYAKINAANLDWQALEPPFEDEYGGSFKRGSVDGQVMKTVLEFNMGDHGGSTLETYYDKSGDPVFLFHVSSHWRFTAKNEGDTEDRVTERRIYFHENGIVRALEKRYVFTEETQTQAAAAAAENKILGYSGQAAARFVAPLKELRSAKAPRIVVLAELLERAILRLTEPSISNDAADWRQVKGPEKRITAEKTQSPGDAAFSILVALKLIDEGEDAEHPDHFDTDILESTINRATVVITLDGLQDDELQAIRYRLELGKNVEVWQLMAIGEQTKKWPDRSEGGKSVWKKP